MKAGTSRPDRVSLDWSLAAEDALLLVSCTCSSYRQGELCGHIVATIFEADRRYLGARVPGRGTLDVIDEAECEWELDDEIQEDIGRAVDRCENRREVKPAPKRSRGAGASKTTYRASAPPNWQSRLQRLTRQVEVAAERFVAPQASVKGREIWYRLNASETAGRECLVIDFQQRERKLDGEFGKRKPLKLSPGEIISLPDALDRELLSWMIGNRAEDQYSRPYCGSQSYYGYRHGSSSQICRCELAPGAYAAILPRLCQSGRLDWLADARSAEADEPAPLAWDKGPPWQFKLQFGPVAEKHAWRLTGVLYRQDETAAPDAVRFADAGVVLFQRTAARLAEDAAARWIAAMRAAGEIEIAAQERDAFLKQLWQAPELPPVELAPECEWREVAVEPTPRLVVAAPRDGQRLPLEATVSFDYRDQTVARDDRRTLLVDEERRELVRRDFARERAAWTAVHTAPVQAPSYGGRRHDAEIAQRLPAVVVQLMAAGWRVEAEGAKLRQAGQFKVSLASGIDWFELEAAAEFDGISVDLPVLLKALQRGQTYVELGDGSRGMLPAEWLARYAPLAEMGTVEKDKIRFVHSQAMLLDAWLAAQPEVDIDATFEQIRDRLRSFEGIKPVDEPVTFHGRLRGYRREGLGWLRFLDEFGFGGCLADDMGLGKTVQVLALLDAQRPAAGLSANGAAATHSPSLVVAPRSLVHNWMAEAQRFTPQLRVLDYTGPGRAEQISNIRSRNSSFSSLSLSSPSSAVEAKRAGKPGSYRRASRWP